MKRVRVKVQGTITGRVRGKKGTITEVPKGTGRVRKATETGRVRGTGPNKANVPKAKVNGRTRRAVGPDITTLPVYRRYKDMEKPEKITFDEAETDMVICGYTTKDALAKRLLAGRTVENPWAVYACDKSLL